MVTAQLLEAMSESMVHSMDASMRFAAEAIREEDPKHAKASSTFAETKEVQELAQVIDTGNVCRHGWLFVSLCISCVCASLWVQMFSRNISGLGLMCKVELVIL